MLLAIDVGNTNTVLGLYRIDEDSGIPAKDAGRGGDEKPELIAHWRVTSHRQQTSDEYGVFFINLFKMNGIAPSQVKYIMISSVVPPVDGTLRQVCETYFHVQPFFVEPGIKTGMPLLVDNPLELGADRLVNASASWWTSARPPPSTSSRPRASTWAAPLRRASASAPKRCFHAPRA
jgi:type III pantothenate kinase